MLHANVDERRRVLGEARPTPARTGSKELESDALVEAEPEHEVAHVGSHRLAEGSHGIDETDLRRQEGIRCVLDGLSSRGIRDDHRCPRGTEQLGDSAGSPRVRRPNHDAVRVHAVSDCRTLAEELWVRHHCDVRSPDGPLDQVDRANWDGRLVDDDGTGIEVWPDLCSRCFDIGKVSSPVIALGRGDAEEDELTALDRLCSGRHVSESARRSSFSKENVEPWFEDRHLACLEDSEPLLVSLGEDDLMAACRQDPGSWETDVASSDNTDTTGVSVGLPHLGLLDSHETPSWAIAATSRSTPSCHPGRATPPISGSRSERSGEYAGRVAAGCGSSCAVVMGNT